MHLKRITAVPMDIGEVRGFCTKILEHKADSKEVAEATVERWLTGVVETVFGTGLKVRRKSLSTPKPLYAGEPVQAFLKLYWNRKVPRQDLHFAQFGVVGLVGRKVIIEGRFVVVVLP